MSLHPYNEAKVASDSGLVQSGNCPTVDEYLLALTNVKSRTFAATGPYGEMCGLMVPFADMSNHSFEPNMNFSLSKVKQCRLTLA